MLSRSSSSLSSLSSFGKGSGVRAGAGGIRLGHSKALDSLLGGSRRRNAADSHSGFAGGRGADGELNAMPSGARAGMVQDEHGNWIERLTPRQERLAKELEDIYRKYGQDDKIPHVERLIREWEGREAELVRRARQKYEELAEAERLSSQFRKRRSCSVCFEFDDPHSGYDNHAVCVHPEFVDGESKVSSPNPNTPKRPAWR